MIDILAYICLLGAGVFIASVGIVWLQNGAFTFAHFTWLEAIIGWIFIAVAVERIYKWLKEVIKHG